MRAALPEDYDRIIAVADEWWGRPIAGVLPRLFLDHFFRTSLVAEDTGGLAGFLIGFVSPSQPDVAYAHFVGVRPELRRAGLARSLYERFCAAGSVAGCREVHAITSPVNTGSIAFHQRLGFTATHVPGYEGDAEMVTFVRALPPPD